MELKPWDNKVSKLILETMEQGIEIFKDKTTNTEAKANLVNTCFDKEDINDFVQQKIDMIWDYTNAAAYLESLIEGAQAMLVEVRKGREKMNI